MSSSSDANGRGPSSNGHVPAFSFEQLEPAGPPAPAPPRADAEPGILAILREEMRAEAERVAEEARAAAREEGYREGLEAARRELEPAAGALVEALEQAAAERARCAEAVEREAVEIALGVAEKALCGALDVQPERVLDVVQGSLRRATEREHVTVLVNPDDLDLVRSAVGSLAGVLGGVERIDVQAERRVARGGAVLRTPAGELDARIATQLERAREVVESELAGR